MPTVKKPAEGAEKEFVVMVVGGAPIYIVEGEDKALDICEALEAGAKASGFAAKYDVVEVKRWKA